MAKNDGHTPATLRKGVPTPSGYQREIEVRRADEAGRSETREPTRVGLVEGALNRVINLTDRVGSMSQHAESHLNRLLSSVPEGKDAQGIPVNAGQMNELHAHLTYLENAIDALNSQIRRIEEL